MAKQLNVNLAFSADTTKVKSQLVDLQKQLDNLIKNPTATTSFGLTKEIEQASVAAASLRTQLEAATNVNTGKLDLGKFSQSMKQSKYQIEDYKEALLSLGPDGAKTFAALAQSITQAEVPLKRSSALLSDFATTLRNTTRWQISSSILHGFLGSIQHAYGYAEDLNESLNNIRIVTGQNVDQMAKFSSEANKAAQALSTTTTEYTNASLIYYQQGLSDTQVKERTDVTIKMANVARESAETVSDQMTAVWNNFYDGSKSLEYYADVMTALGAATASSTDEIATGLNQFAAVANTVGLSYEYATAALATVTATTRQSADVVGTAYKTLFARIQGLSLGETLEDGTDLNKYSKALEAVGISIKDQNGELKDMDTILDEMGGKWTQLSKDQQVALAQTVAGVRQYTQLVALMDNWDFFQENLGTVAGADGTLQEQADIYAESWEAARDRVKAASEEIYSQLLNDDFFIDLNNGFAKLLNGVSDFIDGLGGLKGVLLSLGTIALTVFKDQIATSLQNVSYSLMMTTERGRESLQKIRQDANEGLRNLFVDEATLTGDLAGGAYATQAAAQEELLSKARGMTEEQQKIAQLLVDQHNTLVQNVTAQKELVDAAENQANVEVRKAQSATGNKYNSQITQFSKITKQAATFETVVDKAFGNFTRDSGKLGSQAGQIAKQMQALNKVFGDATVKADIFGDIGAAALDQFEQALLDAGDDENKLEQALQELFDAFKKLQNAAGGARPSLDGFEGEVDEAAAALDRAEVSARDAGASFGTMVDAAMRAESSVTTLGDRLDKIPDSTDKVGRGLVGLGQIISTTAMTISSIKGLVDTWNDEDMSFGDQLITTFTTLGFIIPMAVTAFRELNVAEIASVSSSIAATLGFSGLGAAAKAVAAGTATFGQTLRTILEPIGLVTVAIAAVVGVVYSLVKVFQAIDAATPEGQLKAMEERATELSDALDDAKQAATELSSAFDTYDSAVDKLEECTKGTQEWRDALLEVNNTVLDLLHEYPQLAEYITRTDDGVLQITQAGRQYMQDAADAAIISAQGSYNKASQNARNQEISMKESNLLDKFDSSQVDELVKRVMPELADQTEAEMRKTLKQAFAEDDYAQNWSDSTVEGWIDKIVDASDDIKELSAAVKENTLATEVENQAIADNILSSNDLIQNSAYAEDIVSASGDIYDQLYDQAYKALEDSDWGTSGISKASGVNAKAERIFAEYAEAAGITGATLTDTTGTDGNRKFIYEDANGEEQSVSLEAMMNLKAAADAAEQLGQSAEKLNTIFMELDQSGQAYDQAIMDMVAHGNFEDSTEAEVEALKAAIEEAGSTSKYLNGKFGGDDGVLSDEEAQALGYESAIEMVKAFKQGISDYDDAIEDIGSDWLNAVKDSFDTLDTDDLSLTQKEGIGDILTKALANGGEDTLLDMQEIFTKAADGDHLGALVDTLDGVDWNSITESELKETLEGIGVETEGFDIDLQELINSMAIAGDATKSLAEKYASIHEIIDGIATGDTISAEDYVALGDSADGYFTKLLDGTYKLTGDAEKFYETVQAGLIEEARTNIDNLRDKTDTLTKVSGYDYQELSQNANYQNAEGENKYDPTLVRQQLELIQALGTESEELNIKIAGWQEQLKEGKFESVDTLQEIADEVASLSGAYDGLSETIAENEATIRENELSIAMSYTEMGELKAAYEEGAISVEAFTTAAIALDKELDTEDLDPDELKDFVEYLQDAAGAMEGFNSEMNDNEAQIVAKGIMKMNDAIDTLANNWEDWSSILENSSDGSEEYAEAMRGVIDAVADLLDISSDYVSSDFVKEHLEEIGQAAEGNAEAIDGLKQSLAGDVAQNLASQLATSESEASGLETEFLNLIDLSSQFDNLDSGCSVYLDGEDGFVQSLNNMIAATGMTVDQINALCDSMGFEANFASKDQEVGGTITEKTTHHKIVGYTEKNGAREWDEVESTEMKEVPYKGTVTAFSMTTDGSVPKVNSITKKASGSANNYSSSNSGGTKSSGGKSSGGSKEKDPDKKDFVKDEIDRYYDINNAVAAVNQQLERNEQIQERLDSLRSHYSGKTLIASLKQENQLLKQKNETLDAQYANYQKLYKIQSQELAELQSKLGGSWNGNELQNYSQLFQENLNRYNAAIATYNAMSAEQQEASGKQMIEDAKEAYEEYNEALDRYQDLYYNEMYETENKLAELRQQQLENQLKIIENNLEAWEIDVQLKLDTAEAERSLNDFLKDVEQDFRKIYEDLTINSAFDTKNFDTFVDDAETRMQQIRDVMAEIDKMEASKNANGEVVLGDDFMFGSISEAQEYLKELQNELVDVGSSLNEMYEQVWNNYIDGLDQVTDNFEDINDEFERITNELEYEKELIELVYGDKAYDLMNKYYETQRKRITEQIESTRIQAEFWEDQFNKAYQMNKDKHNVDLNDMSTWTEDMKKAYDEMITSQEKLNDLVLEGIESLRDEYLNNIAKTLDQMDEVIWGMSFDDLKEDWDYIQNKADEYLDDVEGVYQIQTLANKIDTSINEASSLKAQQKLMTLREEEINYLREKENLTQDDIDLAEARYQIALKEIALEDAQNNKTSMKLSRDESGNWTYQYVADDEEVLSKQQELLDAYNNLYTTADTAYQHAIELATSTYEEYKEKLAEIAEDATLSEEEKYIKMQELRDLYMPDITAAMENANIYEQETIYATGAVFAEVCEQDAEAYTTLTDTQKELVDAVKEQHLADYENIRAAIIENYDEIGTKATDTFKETNMNSQTAAATVITQWDGKTGSVKAGMNDAFNSIVSYTKNFEAELENLEKVSGKTIMGPGGVNSDLDTLGGKIDTVGDKTNDMANEACSSLDTLRGFINEVESSWDGVISKIQAAISALQQYIATMSEVTSVAGGRSSGSRSSSGSSSVTSSSAGSGSSSGGSSVSSAEIEGIAGNIWVYGSWGDNPTRHALMKQKFGDSEGDRIYNAVQAKLNSGYGYNGGLQHDKSYYQDYGPSAFYTGGYTGEWGSSGRLGILHEKELVLNANDTQNVLETIQAVRDITGLNNSISSTIAGSLAQMALNALGFSSGKHYEASGSDSENNIFNITAEFPNADDVQTIREAILSLPNIASQYIHES